MSIQMRQRAQELLDGVPSELLPDVIRTLESFYHHPAVPEPQAEEAELIKLINRRFTPTTQEQIDALREKNELGALTEAEHQELMKYVERAEDMDAVRLEAMMKLAELRQVNLELIAAEFAPKHNEENDKA
ncbi:MAG: hypothetical protein F6J87_26720 [Spirulina sp. SIO3F2]|nr:hypothetical protein [Spirulina sp. SIO3F2]